MLKIPLIHNKPLCQTTHHQKLNFFDEKIEPSPSHPGSYPERELVNGQLAVWYNFASGVQVSRIGDAQQVVKAFLQPVPLQHRGLGQIVSVAKSLRYIIFQAFGLAHRLRNSKVCFSFRCKGLETSNPAQAIHTRPISQDCREIREVLIFHKQTIDWTPFINLRYLIIHRSILPALHSRSTELSICNCHESSLTRNFEDLDIGHTKRRDGLSKSRRPVVKLKHIHRPFPVFCVRCVRTLTVREKEEPVNPAFKELNVGHSNRL
mmetsp:Transcript_40379/g.82624  ORF Transcript_40379/g.82624 Transcript_40379/m.82624 type:complete len:263 (+) Transcript_40379:3465-4253(+)